MLNRPTADSGTLIRNLILGLIISAALTACDGPTSRGETAANAPESVAKTESHDDTPTEDESEEAIFKTVAVEYPAASPVLGFIDSRATQSLNGQWRLTVDPMGVGEPGSFMGGFNLNRKPQTGMDLIEYDLAGGQSIRVPGDINSQDERLFFYRGRVWYFRTFDAEPSADMRQHLWFGGANFKIRVFLNGETVGQHDGGYVPFSFDVSDNLLSGRNELIIAIEDNLSADSVPTIRTDWWPYSGLTRDVALISTPSAFIRNAKIQLSKQDSSGIDIAVSTSGFAAGTEVEVVINELELSWRGQTDAEGHVSGNVAATPERWSPNNPKLYEVTVKAGDDAVSDRIGFRTIETRGQQIFLNGEAIKLKGISAHEEPIAEPGVSFTRAHAERLLGEAKALNANFVRAAHYPHSRHLAKVADEIGLLLWEEIPVYWNIAWENPQTLATARNMLRRLIERDWNRASVIIWSVANETPYSKPRMAFLGQLIEDARAIDGTRLVSAALLGGMDKFGEITLHLAVRALEKLELNERQRAIFEGIVAAAGDAIPSSDASWDLQITDPLGELVDIVGYNEYFGWYYAGALDRQLNVGTDVLRAAMRDFVGTMTISANVDKPIQISEFGAGAKAGRKGGAADVWTEEYQASVYESQIDLLSRSSQVQGMTPWVLKDFRAMLRTHPEIQQYYNRKGLVDPDGQRKMAFGVLADFYAQPW